MTKLPDMIYNFIQVILQVMNLAHQKNASTFKFTRDIRSILDIELIFNII